MTKWVENISLESNNILLAPLEIEHKGALLRAASDGKLWELWFTSVPSKSTIDSYLDNALKQKENGTEYPFVVINKKNNEIIGATRFCKIQPENKRLEIGYTWYAKKHQRTGVNTDCKYLLLSYAFEKLNCIAVQFMTNSFNLKSREAIERLGAKQDGILRNHRLNSDGTYRDTVVFSITDQEWPNVKKSLEYFKKK